ncbi:hypothetical protein BDB01DRAFT_779862 [Pilobolus umbonatus]|nr:hypothetical protein BDB01DRAFT_779862 [Pilobolus umbonatus]
MYQQACSYGTSESHSETLKEKDVNFNQQNEQQPFTPFTNTFTAYVDSTYDPTHQSFNPAHDIHTLAGLSSDIVASLSDINGYDPLDSIVNGRPLILPTHPYLPATPTKDPPKPSRERAPWTPEEDQLLRLAVQLYGDKTEKWSKIAACVPGRNNKNCRKRWFHSLDPTLRKGAWTDEEDTKLREGVSIHSYQWSKIADMLEGRTDDQCAKRWRESLDPSIDRSEWTHDEDRILMTKYEEYGSQWQKIAFFFDGRPGLHCRNRWRKLQRILQVEKKRLDIEFHAALFENRTESIFNPFLNATTSDHLHGQHEDGNPSDSNSANVINNNTNNNHPSDSYNNINNINPINDISNNNTINTIDSNSPHNSPHTLQFLDIDTPIQSNDINNTDAMHNNLTPNIIPSSSSTLSSQSPISDHDTHQALVELLSLNTDRDSSILAQLTEPTDLGDHDDSDISMDYGPVKPYGCGLAGCHAVFSTTTRLHCHVKINHFDQKGKAKPYKCAITNCSKRYKNLNGLQYHLRDAKGSTGQDGAYDESNGRIFQCGILCCKKAYRSANGLSYHQQLSHNSLPLHSLSQSPEEPSTDLPRHPQSRQSTRLKREKWEMDG